MIKVGFEIVGALNCGIHKAGTIPAMSFGKCSRASAVFGAYALCRDVRVPQRDRRPQGPGQPLPDHGEQVCDTTTFRGSNCSTPHPQYYYNTSIAPERAPDQPARNHRTIIVSGVLAAECQHVMQQFFREKRENAEKAGWRSNQERLPRQRINGVTRRNARRDHAR